MEVGEQSDQINNIQETSQEEQPVNMTVPDTSNQDLYVPVDTQVTSDSKEAENYCAANVELNGYEDGDAEAINKGSHFSVEADNFRTDPNGKNDDIAMETEVTVGQDGDLGEDGEILEDGEIASDQEGEVKDESRYHLLWPLLHKSQ